MPLVYDGAKFGPLSQLKVALEEELDSTRLHPVFKHIPTCPAPASMTISPGTAVDWFMRVPRPLLSTFSIVRTVSPSIVEIPAFLNILFTAHAQANLPPLGPAAVEVPRYALAAALIRAERFPLGGTTATVGGGGGVPARYEETPACFMQKS